MARLSLIPSSAAPPNAGTAFSRGVLFQCTDLGYHLSLSRVLRGFLTSRYRAQQNLKTGLQQLDAAVTALNQAQDRDALLQAHNTTFCLPFRFQFFPHEGDQVPAGSGNTLHKPRMIRLAILTTVLSV